MEQRLYSIQEAEEFLQVSKSTIYNLMQQGQLTGRTVGGQVRFYMADLQACVLTRAMPTAPAGYAGRPNREQINRGIGRGPGFMKLT
jgi:excisionase family DNA binding protein